MSTTRRRVGFMLVAVLALGAACAKPSEPESATGSEATAPPATSEFQVCQDPRPQACTREYLPVCAHTMAGSLETRPNACVACADPKILGHRPEACR